MADSIAGLGIAEAGDVRGMTGVLRLFSIIIGMTGVRIDAGRRLLIWIPAAFALTFVAQSQIGGDRMLEFAFACWVAYYLVMTLILGTGIKRWLRNRLGDETAWALYEMVCGLQFYTIGCGFTAAAVHGGGSLGISPILAWALAVPTFVIGMGVKVWATWVVGLDTYYYRDLFLEEQHGEFSAAGPYRWLSNPMYGLGNVHGYSAAFIVGSTIGLLYAAICHASIYGFYLLVERPFIHRLYSASDLAPSDSG